MTWLFTIFETLILTKEKALQTVILLWSCFISNIYWLSKLWILEMISLRLSKTCSSLIEVALLSTYSTKNLLWFYLLDTPVKLFELLSEALWTLKINLSRKHFFLYSSFSLIIDCILFIIVFW